MTNTHSIVVDNTSGSISNQEKSEEELADESLIEIFDNEENAQKTSSVIASFVESYSCQKNTLALDVWLNQEFSKYPEIWANEDERQQATLEIIDTVQKNNDEKVDLYAHLDKGKSRESWLARKIEQGATAAGVVNTGQYAQQVDKILENANLEMLEMVSNKNLEDNPDLKISASRQLHGFIAESDLANQFNINAASSSSGLKAEVPKEITLNSPDILIKDGTGKVLEKIQVKLYQPNERGLANLKQDIKSHDYSNTTLVVNKEHVKELQKEFPDLKIDSHYE
ncbi:MAG: hypothetical protein GQ569_04390, partial [Methylococcaceae bacterium]|nr:hypothetical protein [Methylococcaceae bacterium]